MANPLAVAKKTARQMAQILDGIKSILEEVKALRAEVAELKAAQKPSARRATKK